MSARRIAGIAILALMFIALIAIVSIASDPWWIGPLTVLAGVAIAALLVRALTWVLDS